MKSRLLAITLLLIASSCLFAQQEPSIDNSTIASIRIEGNRRIATETYLYYINAKPGTVVDENVLRDDFRRLWQTGFLNNLTIETEQSPQGVVVFFRVE
jgi:outer membrane protein assembly factor BamA